MPGAQKIQGFSDQPLIWREYFRASELPAVWDCLAGANIFLGRPFLSHLEKTNPCGQKYRLLQHGNQGLAAYVIYRLPLDIFTYSSLRLKLPVWIIGIPCSLSQPGYAATAEGLSLLRDDILSQKGAKLVLNGRDPLPLRTGQTLPSCHLPLEWDGFTAYLDSLRSHYRYRCRQARQRWREVQVDILNPAQFDSAMYRLYEEVWGRSRFQLEKLLPDFFRSFPLPARLLRARQGEQLLGFAFLVDNGDELVFLFTGFDQRRNRELDLYLNLLLETIRFALERGYRSIDFGQTTEAVKMKLGCRLSPRLMYLAHGNPLLNSLANWALPHLEYRLPQERYQVFRQQAPKRSTEHNIGRPR